MKFSAKEMCTAAVLCALTCVLSPISIAIGPVPITLGVFCIFLTGALLPWHMALMSSVVYILIGSVGVPVFSNFTGGAQVIAGPTGGFLAAYPIMAVLISALSGAFKKKGNVLQIISLAASMILALAVCYALGTAWFVLVMRSTVKAALAACVVPFVWIDFLKVAAATALGFAVSKALKKAAVG